MTRQTERPITRSSAQAQVGRADTPPQQPSGTINFSGSALKLVHASPYTFGWEHIADILAQGHEHLAERHYEEIAPHSAEIPYEIDWQQLLGAEQAKLWRIFVCRFNGKLVGYISWWFQYPPQCAGTLHCVAHSFRLAPEHRKGWTGYRFLKAAFQALPRPCSIEVGEIETYQEGRVGLLLERLGLKPTEIRYTGFMP